MNTREWIEFGKMFERTLDAGDTPTLITDNQDGMFCVVIGHTNGSKIGEDSYKTKLDVTTSFSEWFNSPYEAMKFQYMNFVIGDGNTVEESISLDEPLLERLYELSDEKGIPLDELVNDILSQHLIELDSECDNESCECDSACENCSCNGEFHDDECDLPQYRQVATGELLLVGDEVYYCGEWFPVHSESYGYRNLGSFDIRRKVS